MRCFTSRSLSSSTAGSFGQRISLDKRPVYGLQRRGALITGSTSGIGLGVAKSLARSGCNVVLNGFGDSRQIEALQRELRDELGVRVSFHPADLTKPDEIANLMKFSRDTLGNVDILVNNAGIQHVSPIESFPPEKWDAIIALNLSAVFHTTRLAVPHMRASGWGRIVNIASVHGLVASVHKSAYVAAKHGVVGLTKAAALELATAGGNVTCNAICPGWVETPLVQKQVQARAEQRGVTLEAARESLLREKQPSGEFATTEQIGDLSAFLCSEAAQQINGAAITIDGGWTAQ